MKKILFCLGLCVIISITFASDTYLQLRISNPAIINANNGDTVWVKLKDYSDTIPPIGTLIGIYGDINNHYWNAEPQFQLPINGDYYAPDYIFGNTSGMVASVKVNKFHISGTILRITKDPPFK
jgi:hypothetical protein